MEIDLYRIKSEMAQKGWNQSDLAKRAGVSRQRVSRWMISIQDVKVETVGKIADALGIDGRDLLISNRKPDKTA